MGSPEFKFDEKLNVVFLNNLYEGDLEYAGEIFQQYLVSLPAQLAGIDSAFKSNSSEAFRQQLHKIKPVFSYVGLTMITSYIEELERKCQQVISTTELEVFYSIFKNKVEEFNPIVENQLSQLKHQIQQL